MADFVEVVGVERLPPGTGMCFAVAGKNIAVFNVDGSIYAIDDSCLHKRASLGTGKLEGKVVTCRAQGWRFNVTTSSTINVPGYGVASHPAKIVDGKIFVSVA